ncbi:MAG: V-type ATP synthase subunit E family protein [Gaiella sp.]|nr:V-type ATP synthase subunit E family protein [Gaiella sp.]
MDGRSRVNLEPLRRALRAETAADADRRRSEVAADCERIVAEAEAAAQSLAHEARLEGERAAAREAARRHAAAARRARETVLGARRGLVDELRRRADRAVLELRGGPEYAELLERLQAAARAQLEDGAELVVDPPGLGGVVGRRGDASVDYTLPVMAERAIDGLGVELERLWA